MEKKISAAVIIYDSVKQTVVAEHATGRPFFVKGTKDLAKGVMSIPKGEIDDGEDAKTAAVREVNEETGLKLEKSKLKYLGKYEYTSYKDLEMFFYEMNDVDLSKLHCDSFFESPNGKMLPEVNGFSNLHIEKDIEMFFTVQQKVLKKVFSEFKELFC